MHALNIFFNEKKVGKLLYDSFGDDFRLEYDMSWVQNGFALSAKLGLNEQIKSIDIKNFIDNLLPEGKGLDELVNCIQVSKNNKFALLKKIGNETSGAFSFVSDEAFNLSTSFREVSFDELTQRIKQRKQIPITIWDGRPRLSIAGVQEKLPITKIDGKYGFGEGELASTHILKFDKTDEKLVLNEYFSLLLAKSAGLDVTNFELKKFDDEFVLEIERFDRKIISNEKVEKLHLVDGCQLLGVPASFKYERNFGTTRDVKDIKEGVSFKKLDEITYLTKIPLISKKVLLEWCAINLIIGNSDAHGKNISFFISRDGVEIAPFYDIVNIVVYDDIYETSLAMGIDDEFELGKIKAYDIAAHCYNLGITPKLFSKTFENIANKIKTTISDKIFEQMKSYDEEFAKKYCEDILNRIERLSAEAKNATKVKVSDV
ncbi:MAG: serine/threonine-protein kinase HipA [Campylobacterota bacterium]|nr:serine/threonine-protein kinase HipA [Campylobacterota bacterium]